VHMLQNSAGSPVILGSLPRGIDVVSELVIDGLNDVVWSVVACTLLMRD